VDVAARVLGIRHVQSCVMGFSSCMVYSLRTTLSVAIVAMVDYQENAKTSTGEATVRMNKLLHSLRQSSSTLLTSQAFKLDFKDNTTSQTSTFAPVRYMVPI